MYMCSDWLIVEEKFFMGTCFNTGIFTDDSDLQLVAVEVDDSSGITTTSLLLSTSLIYYKSVALQMIKDLLHDILQSKVRKRSSRVHPKGSSLKGFLSCALSHYFIRSKLVALNTADLFYIRQRTASK